MFRHIQSSVVWCLVFVLLVSALGCKSKSRPAASASTETPTSQEDLLARCSELVAGFQVKHYDHRGIYFGSGVLLNERGYALVCGHILLLPGAGIPSVQLPDGRELPCRPVASCPEADVTLVKIAIDDPLPAASLPAHGAVKSGERILVFGRPDYETRRHLWATVGRVDIDIEQHFEILGGDIGPGWSGGPIFNMQGELIGIVNTVDTEKKSLAFGIPIDCIRQEH